MYVYQSLSRENKEVRLLQFCNTVHQDVGPHISLKLRHESLINESSHYAALSYVWGSSPSQDMVGIEVNGRPFLITCNLHAELVRLLRSVSCAADSWLWIDAICINQSDNFEKSWQVSQMGTIFSRADMVFMMTGSGSAETDRAMDFIARIGPRAVASGALDPWTWETEEEVRTYIAARPFSPSQESNRDYEGDSARSRFIYDLVHEQCLYPWSPPGENVCAGILEVLQKDYWHRIWITQEVALAQRAIVVCGERSLSLDDFEGALTAIFQCHYAGLFLLASEYYYFGWELPGSPHATMALVARRRRCRGKPIRLADLVCQHRVAPNRPHYSATDPRDIFFALLGVISDRETLGLTADYSKTPEEVHIAATRALIRDGDLHQHWQFHLDQCVPMKKSERLDNLPSWVPDWEGIGKRGISVYHIGYSDEFAATADKMPILTVDDDITSHILRRPGCYVDVITEVMSPPRWVTHDEWTASEIEDPVAWLQSIIKFVGLGNDSDPAEDYVWRALLKGRLCTAHGSNSKGPTPTAQDIRRFFRRIMRQELIDADSLTPGEAEIARMGLDGLPVPPSDLKTLEEQISYIMRRWPRSLGSINRERTLFKTVKAMFGLGHVAIQPGDIVTLLWGIRSPIILRPRNDEAIGGGYTFLGDAYVDGIMQGEFLDTKPTEVCFDIM
ncbi:hypothetical protein PG993_014843 [Apiospora rasikravindrae]|uniref:Heterokaryon incompatibility domain-containing protein n=1 Tax=Apiospora rasikravindrae TaxID=990691 RepID=A0ABR1RQ52_9PEZI